MLNTLIRALTRLEWKERRLLHAILKQLTRKANLNLQTIHPFIQIGSWLTKRPLGVPLYYTNKHNQIYINQDSKWIIVSALFLKHINTTYTIHNSTYVNIHQSHSQHNSPSNIIKYGMFYISQVHARSYARVYMHVVPLDVGSNFTNWSLYISLHISTYRTYECMNVNYWLDKLICGSA